MGKHRHAENMVNVLKFQTQDAGQKGQDKTADPDQTASEEAV